jgi:hypothetical protein
MTTARFFRDEHGYPRCEVPAPHQALGYFFEQDIQSSISSAEELIQHIDSVSTGKKEIWSCTGNAFNLELAKIGAEIECLWDESMPVCRIALSELRDAAVGWGRLISGLDETSILEVDSDPQLPLPFND